MPVRKLFRTSDAFFSFLSLVLLSFRPISTLPGKPIKPLDVKREAFHEFCSSLSTSDLNTVWGTVRAVTSARQAARDESNRNNISETKFYEAFDKIAPVNYSSSNVDFAAFGDELFPPNDG